MSSNGIACNIAFSAWWTCGFSSCGCGSGRRSASGEQAFHSQNGSWLSFGRLHISKSNSMGWCVHATLRLACRAADAGPEWLHEPGGAPRGDWRVRRAAATGPDWLHEPGSAEWQTSQCRHSHRIVSPHTRSTALATQVVAARCAVPEAQILLQGALLAMVAEDSSSRIRWRGVKEDLHRVPFRAHDAFEPGRGGSRH